MSKIQKIIFFYLPVLARFSLQEDDAHTLAVIGEPGLGKSALLAKLAQTLSHVRCFNVYKKHITHISEYKFQDIAEYIIAMDLQNLICAMSCMNG